MLTIVPVKRDEARAAAEQAKKTKTVVLKPDDWWQKRGNPPPIPEKSPLRSLFHGVQSTTDSKRFSGVKGYFKSFQAEETARRDLTPPALRIIKRREQIEARATNNSTPNTPTTRVPDYYEDTNYVPSHPAGQSDSPKLKLSRANLRRVLSAQSFSDIVIPEDSEEAESLESAWNIKQRKITHNQLEDLPSDHGLTELFARIRIPSEEY